MTTISRKDEMYSHAIEFYKLLTEVASLAVPESAIEIKRTEFSFLAHLFTDFGMKAALVQLDTYLIGIESRIDDDKDRDTKKWIRRLLCACNKYQEKFFSRVDKSREASDASMQCFNTISSSIGQTVMLEPVDSPALSPSNRNSGKGDNSDKGEQKQIGIYDGENASSALNDSIEEFFAGGHNVGTEDEEGELLTSLGDILPLGVTPHITNGFSSSSSSSSSYTSKQATKKGICFDECETSDDEWEPSDNDDADEGGDDGDKEAAKKRVIRRERRKCLRVQPRMAPLTMRWTLQNMIFYTLAVKLNVSTFDDVLGMFPEVKRRNTMKQFAKQKVVPMLKEDPVFSKELCKPNRNNEVREDKALLATVYRTLQDNIEGYSTKYRAYMNKDDVVRRMRKFYRKTSKTVCLPLPQITISPGRTFASKGDSFKYIEAKRKRLRGESVVSRK